MQDQIVLDTVSNKDISLSYKIYKRRLFLSSFLLGIGFSFIIGFSIVAALTQMWALFAFAGVGLILVIFSSLTLAWYVKRFEAAKVLSQLNKYLKEKEFHFVADIASYINLDQNGTLYILKNFLKYPSYKGYKIFNDIIFASDKYNFTDEQIKKEYGKVKNLGKINYHNLKMCCPNCKSTIDFAYTICPYCKKELI